MKKITKSLALTGALMCASVGLVACGGDDNLVNIKATYSAPTEAQETRVNSCVNSLDTVTLEENQSYKVKLSLNVTQTEGEYKSKIGIKVNGHIDEDGNFDFDAKISGKSAITKKYEEIKMALFYEPQTFYYSITGNIDENPGVDVVKFYITIEENESPLAGLSTFLPITDEELTPSGVKNLLQEGSKAFGLEYAETESYVKIKYTQEFEEGFKNDIYVVFNIVNGEDGETLEFAGVHYEFNMAYVYGIVTGYAEFAPSKEAVKKLTDDEKKEYISNSGM